MNTYLNTVKMFLSYCSTTMKLACRGDDIFQDEKHGFPIQQHASTSDFQEIILLPCINLDHLYQPVLL